MLGEFGTGSQYLDYSLVESKALGCWKDGQPWHSKSSLAVQDNISVLQKPPVAGGISPQKGRHRKEQLKRSI